MDYVCLWTQLVYLAENAYAPTFELFLEKSQKLYKFIRHLIFFVLHWVQYSTRYIDSKYLQAVKWTRRSTRTRCAVCLNGRATRAVQTRTESEQTPTAVTSQQILMNAAIVVQTEIN